MSVRRTVALALSAALGLTGLAAVTSPVAAAADTAPYEVTVDPLVQQGVLPWHRIEGVGTGVQLASGQQTRWYSLAGGRPAHAPVCHMDEWDPYGHGDVAVCPDPYTDDVIVHDFATGRTASRSADAGERWLELVAGRQLVRSQVEDGGATLFLLGYGEGAPADRQVFVPGATSHPWVLDQDDTGAVLAYSVAGTRTVSLFDFATGTVTPLPAAPFAGGVESAALGGDRIVLGGQAGTPQVLLVSRTDPAAPGRTVALPRAVADGTTEPGLVGDWIIGRVALLDDETVQGAAELWGVPVDGGQARRLGLTVAQRAPAESGPDGALYTGGRTDTGQTGVYRLAADGTGTPAVRRVLDLGVPYPRENMTLSQGRLVAQTSTDSTDRQLQGYDLALTGTHAATARWSCDSLVKAAACPQILPSATYPRWWTDTGDGRLVTLENVNGTGCTDCAVSVHVTTPGAGGSTRSVVVPYAAGLTAQKLVRASGRYVHFYARSGTTTRSLVVDIETGAVLRDSTNLSQSLWGGRLWSGTGADGTVSAVDVRSGATVAIVDLGTSCSFKGLDVVGKWIFRRCASDPGAVVVHDSEKRLPVWTRIPRDAAPQLGDGFLAFAVTGLGDDLYVEDVRSGEAEEWPLGRLAPDRNSYEGHGWTVDRFGGGVAFLDDWESVRVTGLGGVTSRLAAIDADTPAANIKSGVWKPRWWLSKPGASWTLTLRHKISGKTVRTLTGGEARGIVAPSWDGKDAAGKYVANGAYTWSLTVKPADGQGADLTASGNVAVSGAGAVWRDMAGDDGFGDVLAMDTAGAVSLYRGTGTGGVSSRIAGSGNKFATGSLFVPVGDLNGDRCADVYVRVGSELRAYRPGCGKAVTASSPYTLVGSGWSGYDVLTSPGDVNGDGYADLIARQASTGDMYFYGGTASHVLKARVKIAADWRLYKRIVGAGDLNGDGRGDLLGVDAAGVLWRYFGTSTGAVAPRVKVGGGWGVYSALVGVGDLSGDGRADLLARTTDGKLYRYSSTGTGAYGGRVLIGTGGWNGFKGLF
ncbi:FG-GAP-like repeat-containing protein [Streptomyces hydrogenans]|uniref:FG-GAP-like repeat-containing protein n=1 Tax=Streptomyces hydrogenans TaxID=1873719 RepID=UPI0034380574